MLINIGIEVLSPYVDGVQRGDVDRQGTSTPDFSSAEDENTFRFITYPLLSPMTGLARHSLPPSLSLPGNWTFLI